MNQSQQRLANDTCWATVLSPPSPAHHLPPLSLSQGQQSLFSVQAPPIPPLEGLAQEIQHLYVLYLIVFSTHICLYFSLEHLIAYAALEGDWARF